MFLAWRLNLLDSMDPAYGFLNMPEEASDPSGAPGLSRAGSPELTFGQSYGPNAMDEVQAVKESLEALHVKMDRMLKYHCLPCDV